MSGGPAETLSLRRPRCSVCPGWSRCDAVRASEIIGAMQGRSGAQCEDRRQTCNFRRTCGGRPAGGSWVVCANVRARCKLSQGRVELTSSLGGSVSPLLLMRAIAMFANRKARKLKSPVTQEASRPALSRPTAAEILGAPCGFLSGPAPARRPSAAAGRPSRIAVSRHSSVVS